MKNLRRLSKFFICAAIVTLLMAVYPHIHGSYIFCSDEQHSLIAYILFMIPVIFASMAVSLRFIAKALEECTAS